MRILAKFDIQKIQYMNAFEQTTGVKAKACFFYGGVVIFTVQKALLNRAIGRNAINLKRLMLKLNRKIKIIATPTSRTDLKNFINSIIYPYKIVSLSFENAAVVVHVSPKIKALLIGKGKTKLHELSEIVERFFGIKKVVISITPHKNPY